MAETPKFYIQWTIGRKVPNRNMSNDYPIGGVNRNRSRAQGRG